MKDWISTMALMGVFLACTQDPDRTSLIASTDKAQAPSQAPKVAPTEIIGNIKRSGKTTEAKARALTQKSPTQKPARPSELFVQSAKQTELTQDQLRLLQVRPKTVSFTERPFRGSREIGTKAFVDQWSQGDNSFASDPPNAALYCYQENNTEPSTFIVELRKPELKGATLSYKIALLGEHEGAKQFTKVTCPNASLFIDSKKPDRDRCLNPARRGVDLSGCNLTRRDFSSTDLSNARLNDAILLEADLSNTNLSKADLTNANFMNANMEGVNLTDARANNANLQKAKLINAKIVSAQLHNANLAYADLSSANLINAKASLSNLSHANLSNANLTNTNFVNAYLNEANLTNADLTHAYLTSAILTNANLSASDFSAAETTGIILSNAVCNQSTIDPQGMHLQGPGLNCTQLVRRPHDTNWGSNQWQQSSSSRPALEPTQPLDTDSP